MGKIAPDWDAALRTRDSVALGLFAFLVGLAVVGGAVVVVAFILSDQGYSL